MRSTTTTATTSSDRRRRCLSRGSLHRLWRDRRARIGRRGPRTSGEVSDDRRCADRWRRRRPPPSSLSDERNASGGPDGSPPPANNAPAPSSSPSRSVVIVVVVASRLSAPILPALRTSLPREPRSAITAGRATAVVVVVAAVLVVLVVAEVLLGESRRACNRGETRRGDDGLGYYTGEVMLLERERLLITYSDSAND